MATTNKSKLTVFKSGQTVVSANFLNSLYQSVNGETAGGNEAYGHVHDGQRLDGHAQKINLTEHVDGLLSPSKIDGNILSQISLSESGSGSLTGDSTIYPDGPSGSITLVAGNGIELESDSENRTLTFKTAAESITYSLSTVSAPVGAGIRLSDSNGTNSDILIKEGSNVLINRNPLGAIVISAADTTYNTSAQNTAGGALIRLTSSSATNDDLKLESGDGITVQRISADIIRISAQIPEVPLTTKGDLLVYGDSGNTKLPIGTDGQVLSADSGTATGLQWVDALTLPTTTAGDILVHDGTTNVRLPIGTNGQYLKINTSVPERVEWSSFEGGNGDVVGPDFATDNAIVRYDLATGKLVQNSLVTIDDSGLLAGTIIKVGDDNPTGEGNVVIGDGTATTSAMMTVRGPNTSYRGMRIDNVTTEIWFAGSPSDSSGNYVLRSGGTTNVVTVTSSGDMTINGDLTVIGNDIKSSTATAITLNGSKVNVLGTLTSQSKFDYQTTLFAPQTSRYTTANSLEDALDSGVGRYFIGFSDDTEAVWNISFAAPGASQVGRIMTISNVGLGKINLNTAGDFAIPFSSTPVSSMQLASGEWAELIGLSATRWMVVCGGTVTDYSVP